MCTPREKKSHKAQIRAALVTWMECSIFVVLFYLRPFGLELPPFYKMEREESNKQSTRNEIQEEEDKL